MKLVCLNLEPVRICNFLEHVMTPAKLAFLLGCMGWTGNPHSQVETSSQQPEATLHVSSNLVVVDVVVTDAAGQPVRGLKESDFTVSDNKVAQKIASFDERSATGASKVPPVPK